MDYFEQYQKTLNGKPFTYKGYAAYLEGRLMGANDSVELWKEWCRKYEKERDGWKELYERAAHNQKQSGE